MRNNSISTYGDQISASAQDILMIAVIWWKGVDGVPVSWSHISFVVGCFSAFIAILVYSLHHAIDRVVIYGISILLISRLPQIISNFSAKSAGIRSFIYFFEKIIVISHFFHYVIGAQSSLTVLNGLFGATSKCFMAYVETKDKYIFVGSLLAVTTNLILLLQIYFLTGYELKTNLKSERKKND
jgi:hypothetical protein